MTTKIRPLVTTLAHRLDTLPAEKQWLIESLWRASAVGIIGGEPKSYKSFLALQMAVSVASGKPCLHRFEPKRRGPVLVHAAEDAGHIVRQRLTGITSLTGCKLQELPVHVVKTTSVRLDVDADRAALTATIAAIRPVLVVLDPFVRLHRIDENNSGEVAPLLAYLRTVNREFGCAIILVHHMKKGGHNMRGGQALRGSSEFHAWGDSNLYSKRSDMRVMLEIEHRDALSVSDLALQLHVEGEKAMLVPATQHDVTVATELPPAATLGERIKFYLQQASGPVTTEQLRRMIKVRKATLVAALREMVKTDDLTRVHRKFQVAPERSPPTPVAKRERSRRRLGQKAERSGKRRR